MAKSAWIGLLGLLLDLSGAVLVLAADWRPLYNRLLRIGAGDLWLSKIPIMGYPLRRLNYLHQLTLAENRLLSGEFEEVNWIKNAPPINKWDDGFDPLKDLLVHDLD